MDLRFSIIIQSYLGGYNGAAKDRETKFNRALDSLKKQSFQDFEVIVISDGCERTVDISVDRHPDFDWFQGYFIPKQKLWSGLPRNTGIDKAEGQYIVYLDTDDFYGEKYLEVLDKSIKDAEWYWFDDFVWDKAKSTWTIRRCDINTYGKCGTSNICHKNGINARWPMIGNYKHDWIFINNLKEVSVGKKLELAGYFVGHIPGRYDI
jgi:glycosyltransferase involved in cell wall biosynthesis